MISNDDSVGSLHDARPAPTPAPARAARARHDRRGRRRAALHPVRRVPAARGPRARGRRAAARTAGRGCGSTDAAWCSSGTPTRCSSAPRWPRPTWPRRRARWRAAGASPSFQSVALRIALPAMQRCRARRRGLRCELVEAEPEWSLPALALGDVDLVLADEWAQPPPARPGRPRGPARRPGARGPARRPPAGSATRAVALAGLAGDTWVTGQRGRLGGDDAAHVPRARRLRPRHPPPRERRGRQPRARRRGSRRDAAARARRAEAHPASPCAPIAEGRVDRTVFAATREADAARPSCGRSSRPSATPPRISTRSRELTDSASEHRPEVAAASAVPLVEVLLALDREVREHRSSQRGNHQFALPEQGHHRGHEQAAHERRVDRDRDRPSRRRTASPSGHR